MKKIVLSFFCLILWGCSNIGVEPLYIDNGEQIYKAKCNGAHNNIGDCMKVVSEQCNGNFNIIHMEEKSNSSVSNTSHYNNSRGTGNSYYNTSDRNNVYGNHTYNGSNYGNSTTTNTNIVNRMVLFTCK